MTQNNIFTAFTYQIKIKERGRIISIQGQTIRCLIGDSCIKSNEDLADNLIFKWKINSAADHIVLAGTGACLVCQQLLKEQM